MIQSTPAQPCSTSSTIACHICSVSVTKKYPQPSETSMKSSGARLDQPPRVEAIVQRADGTEKSRYGSQCETTAKPPSAGEWNFWNATQ